MTKILFVTNDAWFFVSHRLPIGKAVAASGMSAVVAAREDPTVARILDSDCQFASWKIAPRGKSLFGEIRAVASLYKIMRAHKPDLVHLITIKPVLYGGLLARLLRVPACVYAVSGLGSVFLAESLKASLLRLVIKPLYRLAINHPNATLIFQNPDDRDQLLKQLDNPKLHTQLIKGSGVNLDDYQLAAEPPGRPVVTLAARLLKDKGILEFVEAAKHIRSTGVEAHFQIAGANVADGNPAAFTETELAQLDANVDVTMLGHCDNIPALFAQSSIVVLPSYREGLPKVLVEAAAAGRAVITTDVPGCRDAVIENKTALLIPPRDSDALANALLRLLGDKTLRTEMGTAGRKLVEAEMHIDIVVQQHLAIYKNLLPPPTA